MSKAQMREFASKNVALKDAPDELLAENENRLIQQRKRSLYVGLPGNLSKVSDSVLKALHPDILNVRRNANAAFLIFSSEPVRNKAFPIIAKAKIKNKPIKLDYCCEKSKIKKPRKVHPKSGLNLNQLVVTDLTKETTSNVLELIFPKAVDFKLLNKKGTAYVNFSSEEDALKSFKKGKDLKIASCPVVVRYRSAVVDGDHIADEKCKPSSGEEKSEPSSVEEKSKPSSGDKKSKPKAGKEKSEPSSGEEKSKPSSGDKKSKPSSTGKKTKPKVSVDDDDIVVDEKSEPSAGVKKPKPSSGEEKSKPKAGGKKSKPKAGVVDDDHVADVKSEPSSGVKKSKPSSGVEKSKPSSGIKKPKPSSAGKKTKPKVGGKKSKPNAGGDAK